MLTADREQDVLVMDFTDVPFIDSTAALAVEDIILKARDDKDYVILCGMRSRVREVLARFGTLRLLPENQLIDTRSKALVLAEQLMKEINPPS